jgi:hypothetical protein
MEGRGQALCLLNQLSQPCQRINHIYPQLTTHNIQLTTRHSILLQLGCIKVQFELFLTSDCDNVNSLTQVFKTGNDIGKNFNTGLLFVWSAGQFLDNPFRDQAGPKMAIEKAGHSGGSQYSVLTI